MEDALQRLLDAELRAEAIAQQAEAAQERVIQDALQQAQAAAAQFAERIPELHAAFLDKAQVRAAQSIAELSRRYDERKVQLHTWAETREDAALEAAFTRLIAMDPSAT